MKALVLTTGFLIERELRSALKSLGIQVIKLETLERPPEDAVRQTKNIVKEHKPDFVFTLNAAGLDRKDELASFFSDQGIFLMNWFVDDPFFFEYYRFREIPGGERVLHFVSDASNIPAMKERGFNTHFLPLAFDPDYFNPEIGKGNEKEYDVVFVGNSTMDRMDWLIKEKEEEILSRHGKMLAECMLLYNQDPTINIEQWLLEPVRKATWWDDVPDRDKFRYIFEWYVGYLRRKDLIVSLAGQEDFSFFCYGDHDWERLIPKEKTSFRAAYYENLCNIYHSAKINLNNTRSQIRNGFTQRVFDVLGSKRFLLTDKRDCNRLFFKTEGPEKELVEYSDKTDLFEKIRYYLANPEERNTIAEAGYDKVVGSHTYRHRVSEMLQAVKEQF